MANELVGAEAYLFAKLSGDAALAAIVGARIYRQVAPDKDPATGLTPAYPLIAFHRQGGIDTIGPGATRIFAKPLYLVRVLGEAGGIAALRAAADRIDAVLTDTTPETITVGGVAYAISGCCREQPFDMTEFVEGRRIEHLGGLYRIYLR
jgi:hypothetical protein